MTQRPRLTVAAFATVVFLSVVLTSGVTHGQTPTTEAQPATVTVEAPSKSVSAADTIDVNVNVTGASNLAGFQFVLSYDSSLLTAQTVAKGDFLTKTGRQIECQDPTIDNGAARYVCVTLGLTPPGPDGEGTLAVVTFKTSKNGTSPMALSNVKLVHPDGSVLTSTTVDGKLTIGGSGGLGTGARIAIGGGAAVVIIAVIAFLFWRRRRLAAQMSTDADSPSGDVTQV